MSTKKHALLDLLLQRMNSVAPEPQAAQASQDSQALQDLQAALSGAKVEAETAQAAVASLTAQVAELTAKLTAVNSELAGFRAEKRKSVLTALLGDEAGEKAFDAMSQMPDAEFNNVVQALSASREVEKESPVFKELGVGGSVAPNMAEEDPTARILREKYIKKD